MNTLFFTEVLVFWYHCHICLHGHLDSNLGQWPAVSHNLPRFLLLFEFSNSLSKAHLMRGHKNQNQKIKVLMTHKYEKI